MADGGDAIARALRSQGVTHLFTLCGGHISPVLVAAKRHGIRVIDTRHEATAVFAADATSRLTGIPGVAAVTAGPGVTNAITAVVNAKMAQSPLVLIGGAVPTILRGRGALQDIDQRKLFKGAVKWFSRVERDCDILPVMEEAFDVSRSGIPGPVFVECPIDTLYDEVLVRDLYAGAMSRGRSLAGKAVNWYVRRHVDRMFACRGLDLAPGEPTGPPASPIDGRAARAVAGLVARSSRPVMVLGSQAMVDPVVAGELAGHVRKLGIPVYLSGMARGLLGMDARVLLQHARSTALKEADLVILAGVPLDFRLGYGRTINRGAKVIAIRREPDSSERNRRPDLRVQADPARFIAVLASMRGDEPADWSPWVGHLRDLDAARQAEIDAFGTRAGTLLNPVVLCKEIDALLPDDSILIGDGGDFVATASYVIRPRGPLSWLDPGPYGTLGVGAGFALAAKLARPSAEVWILFGDGAAGYSLAELDTFVRHGIPVIAVIGNDAGWTQIWRDQFAILGDDVATVLRHSAYHDVAGALGATGFEVSSVEDLRVSLPRAREIVASGKPVLLNALMDRTEFRKGSISM